MRYVNAKYRKEVTTDLKPVPLVILVLKGAKTQGSMNLHFPDKDAGKVKNKKYFKKITEDFNYGIKNTK